jgi:2-keto-4-pentenoate hydratase
MVESFRHYVRTTLNPVTPLRLESSQVFTTLSDAYRAVREHNASAEFGAAWKLGGTTEFTRRLFAVDDVYFGALHQAEIAPPGGTVPPHPLAELKGEVEVALRIAQDTLSFDAWCIALEMPASPITNLAEVGVKALIADRCAAGCLVLAPARPLADLGTEPDFPVWVEHAGKTLCEGHTKNLLLSPVAAAQRFLELARAHGFVVRPGQWVSTGGLTPCVPFEAGRQLKIFADGVLALELTPRRA